MPRNQFETRFGLLAQFDARPFESQSLYNRGGGNVAMPAFSGVGDGLFNDAMVFLNGRKAVDDMATLIETAWNAATGATPNVEVIIDADDKLEFSADLAFSIAGVFDFAVFGIDPAGQTAVFDGVSRYVLTAANDWQRGLVTGSMRWSVPTAPLLTVLDSVHIHQDMPSYIQAAVPLTTLERMERVAGYTTYWSIDEEGHAVWTSTTAADITWVSTGFRDLLGFDGSEASTLIGSGVYSATSTYPIAGVLVPSRPITRQPPGAAQEASSRRTNSNGRVGNSRGTFPLHFLELHLDGPDDCKDEQSHWLKRCLPSLSEGRRITFYQDWGESRLYGNVWDQDYGNVYTVEDDGYRGRIDGWVTDITGAQRMSEPNRRRRRIPMSVVIEERPYG